MVLPNFRSSGKILLWAVLAGGLLFLALLALQLAEMAYVARLPASKSAFCPEGDRLVVCSPRMVRGSFPRRKEPGAFRVFIVGSSQAMGSPYVFQRFNTISRLFPNEGGLATWLQDYLSAALPGRAVEVINAAQGNSVAMNRHLEVFREVAAAGSPDLVVVLAGNNERPAEVRDNILPAGVDLDAALAPAVRSFRGALREMTRLSSREGFRLYLLTVPNNVRDYIPEGDEAAALFRRARALDEQGRRDEARLLYVRAKDRDRSFFRTRSAFNEAIRQASGPGVRVIDMERLLRAYAQDGIPGGDLFHDACHLKLRANQLAAYEVARYFTKDYGLSPDLGERLRGLRLRSVDRRALGVLYWLKVVKWAQYRFLRIFFPRELRSFEPNAGAVLRGYWGSLQDLKVIDDQILLRRDGVMAGSGRAGAGAKDERGHP